MIRTLAVTIHNEFIENEDIAVLLADQTIKWFWADFRDPSTHEASRLETDFAFHPLAVEDCFHSMQRPKYDHYENFEFFVMHSLQKDTFAKKEVDIFSGRNYVVTFHLSASPEIDAVWEKARTSAEFRQNGAYYIIYSVIDKIVDEYFPPLYQMEDRLNEIEEKDADKTYKDLIDEVFDIRGDLLQLRRTIVPMRDLLYRMLDLRLDLITEHKAYYRDVYDHLLKQTELIQSNREMTSDMRDNYQTINSNRMNEIMMTLTIVSTIFIPLTFIAGLYGMNFTNMPELTADNGYFITLAVMAVMAGILLLLFKWKGWFNIFK